MTALSPQWAPLAEASPPSSSRTAASFTAGSATVLLSAAAWVLAVHQMHGMDDGPSTGVGSFRFFVGLWTPMMTAMMLPGTVPVVCRRVRAGGGLRVVPAFLVPYLALWALTGGVVYALYRPHGHVAAGAVTVAAGLYELTPLKAHFRRCCHARVPSGLRFGVNCLGSSAGLMLVLLSLGVMSVTWMALVTALVLIQKVMPANAAIDVPVALALVAFGVLVLAMPMAVPGLGSTM